MGLGLGCLDIGEAGGVTMVVLSDLVVPSTCFCYQLSNPLGVFAFFCFVLECASFFEESFYVVYLLSDTTVGSVLGVFFVEHIEGFGVVWFKMTSLECFNVGSSFVGGVRHCDGYRVGVI